MEKHRSATIGLGSVVILTEKISVVQEIAWVVNAETGELLPAATYVTDPESLDNVDVRKAQKTEASKYFTRNARIISRQRKKKDAHWKWREARGLQSIEDVRNKEDLEAVLGDYSWCTYHPSLNAAWFLANTDGLSHRAKDFIHIFSATKVQALNHGIVTNDEIRKLMKDRSGNYTIYLRQLKEYDCIKIRNLTKTDRLITLNPILGFRGTERMRLSAVKHWYEERWKKDRDSRKYEDRLLEAA